MKEKNEVQGHRGMKKRMKYKTEMKKYKTERKEKCIRHEKEWRCCWCWVWLFRMKKEERKRNI